MKNVLVITSSGKYDGVAFWRVERPFAYLPVNMIRPSFFENRIDERVLEEWMIDCIFMSNPTGSHNVRMAKIARKAKVPVWIDYDDDYLHINPENPFFHLFEDAPENVMDMLQFSDYVTVTNKYLADEYGTKDIIDNAWDSELLGEKLEGPVDENVVFWRGGPHSIEDLRASNAEKMVQDNPGANFVFMGTNPDWIVGKYPNTKNFYPTGPMTYFNILKQLRPKTFLAPMRDNAFNRGRSRISWYESVWCGADYLGPKWFDYSEVPMLKDENKKRMRILGEL